MLGSDQNGMARIFKVGVLAVFVPIVMAANCFTVTITDCPTEANVGAAVTLALSSSGGTGTVTFATVATNAAVTDGDTAAPSVTPAAAGEVAVTVTGTDETDAIATAECVFTAVAVACV